MNTRVGAVIDALVAQLQSGTALLVFDGPAVSGDTPADFVTVAAAPDGESRTPLRQQHRGLGANSRDETGEITVTVHAVSGDTAMKPVRDRAIALVGEVETALRADPTLGGTVQTGWLELSEAELHQSQTAAGCAAAIEFTVSYKARI